MKKGFTLIELLAVIVILAIIAVIAVPIVIDIIEDAKINSVKTSASMYLKATELYISNADLNKVKINPGTYPITEDGNICIGIIEESICNGEIIKIEVKGNKPNKGKIKIDEKNNIQVEDIEINGYVYYENNTEKKVEKAIKETIESDNSVITLNSSKVPHLTNYRIYGNGITNEELSNVDLPDEYQLVNFIESTGTQYIDTGFTPTGKLTVEGKIYVPKPSKEIAIIGTESYGWELGFTTSENRMFSYLANLKSSIAVTTTSSIWNTELEFVAINDLENSHRSLSINIDDKNSSSTTVSEDYKQKLLLFNYRKSYTFTGKLYYMKIYDNDRLVRDYVPCYEKNSGVIGLYDLVEGEFYINAGTGEFLKGNDISPLGDLVTDDTDEYYGKYKIPIKVSSKNIADPKQVDNFVAGMQALGTSYSGNSTDIITDESGRKLLVLYPGSGYGHENASELKKIFSGIFKENIQYTISFDYYRGSGQEVSVIALRANYSDETYNEFWDNADNKKTNVVYSFEKTTAVGKSLTSIILMNKGRRIYLYLDTLQIEEGTNATEYEPYIEPKTYTIYLEEPLRCVGKVCDYIDYESGKVVRYIDANYNILSEPVIKNIELPKININETTSKIFIETSTPPSKVSVNYYK